MTQAVTAEAPEASAEPGGPESRPFLDHLWIFVIAIGLLLIIFGWQFVKDPTLTAPTRDPAWYTWRSGVIAHSNPGLVPQDWGPFHMFGGGYRVSVPVIGALLDDLAGSAQSSFAAFMMIFIPILAGLAWGAGAYRSSKSATLYLLALFVTGIFYLTTPYVGYLDDVFVLFVLAAVIGFLEPARRSWGPRIAVILLSALAAYTHPTTCVVFLGSMIFAVLFHIISMKFDFRALLARDLPALLCVMGGMIGGLILWPLGKFLLWGTAGNIADAALPPPYTRAFFLDRLVEWVKAEYPIVVIPLIVIAIVWIGRKARADKKPADAYRTQITWWLLPYFASLVFVLAGKVLPYYRFMNATSAIMPLTALGLWVVGVWIMKKTNRNVFVATILFVVLVAGAAYAIPQGLKNSQWSDPKNQWIDQSTRVAMASVQSIAESNPSRPILFVNNYAEQFQAYGWSKTYANVGRAGLSGDVAPRTFQYFGGLPEFLQGKPTVVAATAAQCTPIVNKALSTDDLALVGKHPVCTYDLISRGFLAEEMKGVSANGGTPYVFLVNKFNTNSSNLAYFGLAKAAGGSVGAANPQGERQVLPEGVSLTSLGPDVLSVTGPGYATPTAAQIAAAKAAGTAEADVLANPPGRFSDPLHLLRVLVALIFLLAIPGLIAAPFFELNGWQAKLGFGPAISLGMNIMCSIFVIALTRSAFVFSHAVAAILLSIVIAAALRWVAGRRETKGPGRVATKVGALAVTGGEMIDAMSVPMKKYKSFRALMLTQFISMAADGVVAGTIFASVTNPNKANSGRDVMVLVFLTYLPFAIVAPILGVIADRYDRRKLLVFVNYGRAVLMSVAVLMFLFGIDSVALLSAMSLLVLAGFRLTLMVKGAGLPDSVEGEDLLLANSLSQAGGTIFQAAGAIFGVGMAKVFIHVNAGWFAIAGVVLYVFAGIFARGIKRLEAGSPNESFGKAMKGLIRSVVDGVKEVAQRPAAAIGILSFWFTRSLAFGFIALSILFATVESLSSGKKAGVIGQLIPVLFAGIGAGIGLFYAQKLKDRKAPARVIVTFMFLAGGSALLTPLGAPGRYAAAFFAGLAFFLVKVAADTLTQQALPDDFRGRAYAFFDITYALSYALPAAILFGASKAGVPLGYVVAAYGLVVVLMAAGLGAWSRKLGLYAHVSDDLTEEEIVTGIPE